MNTCEARSNGKTVHSRARKLPNARQLQVLHWAVTTGNFSQCDLRLLTEENLRRPHPQYGTLLHEAARWCTLNFLPTQFLTQASVMNESTIGTTVMHLAARHGCLHQLPAPLLTLENLLRLDSASGHTCFHSATTLGRFGHLPAELQTPDCALHPDRDGDTPLITAARNGLLSSMPEALLRREFLSVRGALGHTVYHWAACTAAKDRNFSQTERSQVGGIPEAQMSAVAMT